MSKRIKNIRRKVNGTTSHYCPDDGGGFRLHEDMRLNVDLKGDYGRAILDVPDNEWGLTIVEKAIEAQEAADG